jgi:hypothetical protein
MGESTLFYMDNEEIIVINPDGGGSYSLRLDIKNFLKLYPDMSPQLPPKIVAAIKIDSTIFFDSVDLKNSVLLNENEKTMFEKGSLVMNINLQKKEGTVIIKLFYRNSTQLEFERTHILKFLERNIEYGMYLLMANKQLMPEEKLIDYKVADESVQGMENKIGISGMNPLGKAFTFQISNTAIENKFTDSALFRKIMTSGFLKDMKQNASLDKIFYKTTFVVPRKITKYNGNIEEISPDKKTITFKNSLSDVVNEPKVLEYSLVF